MEESAIMAALLRAHELHETPTLVRINLPLGTRLEDALAVVAERPGVVPPESVPRLFAELVLGAQNTRANVG